MNLHQLDQAATALGLPDGERGVYYYLIEAETYIKRGDHAFAVYALIDALAQEDCTRKQWSRIMTAIKFTRKAIQCH